MEAEDALRLFDCYWHELELFKKQQQSQPSSSMYDQNPSKFPSPPSSMGWRTMSEQTMSPSSTKSSQRIDGSFSPSSVLFTPTERLQTIFSGKVASDLVGGNPERAEEGEQVIGVQETAHRTMRRGSSGEKRRKRKGVSKSFSDLEFVELKGFMDLGFVFSEEDRNDSSLSLIIPGLQRLGNEEGEEGGEIGDDDEEEEDTEGEDGTGISRPYLSEAWEMKARREKEDSLFRMWRVPATSSEIDMKDYLKRWAHSVASSVK